MISRTKSFMGVLPWIIMAGMAAWHYGAPVVIWSYADHWVITRQSVSAHVSGRKIRNCQLVRDSEAGFMRSGGIWFKVPFRFRSDPSPGASRPEGHQSFGVWEWSREDGQPVEQVMLRVRHICDRSERVTTQGPFDVPR